MLTYAVSIEFNAENDWKWLKALPNFDIDCFSIQFVFIWFICFFFGLAHFWNSHSNGKLIQKKTENSIVKQKTQ